ncbi:hypothetical protein BDB00DRAFT_827837, partial [Zychaea mexicana]|uniref:uncharacterized protein n=1 Tax=Zychaea mexicana TaxID=64656 RepID=UPI0022FE04E1
MAVVPYHSSRSTICIVLILYLSLGFSCNKAAINLNAWSLSAYRHQFCKERFSRSLSIHSFPSFRSSISCNGFRDRARGDLHRVGCTFGIL